MDEHYQFFCLLAYYHDIQTHKGGGRGDIVMYNDIYFKRPDELIQLDYITYFRSHTWQTTLT